MASASCAQLPPPFSFVPPPLGPLWRQANNVVATLLHFVPAWTRLNAFPTSRRTLLHQSPVLVPAARPPEGGTINQCLGTGMVCNLRGCLHEMCLHASW